MSDFCMPALGADMAQGTLVTWHRQPGERIERGDIIAEVETEKGIIEIECFTSGVVERLLVEPGRQVPVGTPLAVIRESEVELAAPAVEAKVTSAPAPAPARVLPLSTPSARRLARESGIDLRSVPARTGSGTVTRPDVELALQSPVLPSSGPRRRISPLARRRARELRIDVSKLHSSSPDGVLCVRDVERQAEHSALGRSARGDAGDKQAAMRHAIAAAMSHSNREIPHYYVSTSIDMARALAWLKAENECRGMEDRLIPGVLLLKAAALAFSEVPELNAHWRLEGSSPFPHVHLGVAVSLRQGGLVAPAIHHADRLSLSAMMAALRDLVTRARAGGLRGSEMSDATVTVTSLGERGVDALFPIIIPPQVAMVGFGKISERPWCVDGAVVPRPLVAASLAGDHRVTDGHRGGRYLAAVERLLQSPEEL